MKPLFKSKAFLIDNHETYFVWGQYQPHLDLVLFSYTQVQNIDTTAERLTDLDKVDIMI